MNVYIPENKLPLNAVILQNVLKIKKTTADKADPEELSRELSNEFSNCSPERITELLNEMDCPKVICKSASSIDLNNIPAVEFFIAGILSEGLTLLNAPPKGGKSRMMLQMALAIANGEPFFHRPCKKTGVMYLAFEDDLIDLGNRLKMFTENPPDNLYVCTGESIDYRTPKIGRQLTAVLEENMKAHPDIRVIMIDVYGVIQSDKQRKEDFMDRERRDFSTLKSFAGKHRVAIVVAHHVSNTTQRTGKLKAIGSGAGSYVVAGTVHAEMLITPEGENKERYFMMEGRRIPSQKFVIMDDFPRWQYAGTKEEFETANDPLISTIRMLTEQNDGKWRGTAAEIMKANNESDLPKLTCSVNRNTFNPTVQRRLTNVGISYRVIKNGSGVLHDFRSIS